MDDKMVTWLMPRAEVFKALGHPTRLFIAQTLRSRPHAVSELVDLVGVDGSTISKHLSVLRNAGVIVGTRSGTTIHYRLACNCLTGMLDAVESVLRLKAVAATQALSE